MRHVGCTIDQPSIAQDENRLLGHFRNFCYIVFHIDLQSHHFNMEINDLLSFISSKIIEASSLSDQSGYLRDSHDKKPCLSKVLFDLVQGCTLSSTRASCNSYPINRVLFVLDELPDKHLFINILMNLFKFE